MSIEVRVHRKFSSRVDRARLQRIARRTMSAEKKRANITIYITTDSETQLLNRKYHATNAPTDVLSFPTRSLAPCPTGGLCTGRRPRGARLQQKYLGDIVISYDRARVQAQDAGWRIADELDLLAVHGVLHLLGYDDLTPRARMRIWARKEKILGKPLAREK